MDFQRLFDIPAFQAARYPQEVALAGLSEERWYTWSTADLIETADLLARALYRRGFRKGNCFGVLTQSGSPEWLAADLAMLRLGIIPVPIHVTARPDEIAFICRDAGLSAFVLSDAAMLEKLIEAGVASPAVFSMEPAPGSVDFSALLAEGRLAEPLPPDGSDAVSDQNVATILYTSGTTGTPKGVVLTHANIVSNVKSVLAIVPVEHTMTAVSFLPLSHIFERMVVYVYMAAGVSVWFAPGLETLPRVLQTVRPHLFTAVPRVLERSYERLLERQEQQGRLGRRVLKWALRLGERYPYAAGGYIPPLYLLKRMLADFLVYRHWRRALGGRVQAIVVGAAALQPRLGRLFCAAGIQVREGYGLTETSPVIAFNRFEPGGVRFGTVGIPLPGVEVRIAEPGEHGAGEIEVRGPNVMQGYLSRPDETRERFTPDGWLRTGDLGKFEHKRFLKITGRKSELFKTSSGKFVAPVFVEQQLMHSGYIAQAMALGLNQPHVGALIVPNFERLEAWCHANKVHWTAPEYMVHNPKVHKLIQQEIEAVNKDLLGPVEQVRSFQLLAGPWTAENGLLTPTLKLRREEIGKRYAAEIKKLFA